MKRDISVASSINFYAFLRSNLLKLSHQHVDTPFHTYTYKYSRTNIATLLIHHSISRSHRSLYSYVWWTEFSSWKFIEITNREWNRTRLETEAGHGSKELDDDISRSRLISMCISHTNKGESSFTGFGSFGGTVHETCIRTDKDKGREGARRSKLQLADSRPIHDLQGREAAAERG